VVGAETLRTTGKTLHTRVVSCVVGREAAAGVLITVTYYVTLGHAPPALLTSNGEELVAMWVLFV